VRGSTSPSAASSAKTSQDHEDPLRRECLGSPKSFMKPSSVRDGTLAARAGTTPADTRRSSTARLIGLGAVKTADLNRLTD
jgi:hypothetical protein